MAERIDTLRLSHELVELLLLPAVAQQLPFDHATSSARYLLSMSPGQRSVSRALRNPMTAGEHQMLVELREWLTVGARYAEHTHLDRLARALSFRTHKLTAVLGIDAVTQLGELV